MSATILKQDYRQNVPAHEIYADGAMDTSTKPTRRWFTDIITETSSPKSHLNVNVVDNGNEVEFQLPEGTAQFAEMSVLDSTGKTIWRTQSFNKKSIVWPKQTTFGSKVPVGRYMFRMKQGNRQASGIATVSG